MPVLPGCGDKKRVFNASAADPGRGRAGTCHKQALSWSLRALGAQAFVRKAGKSCVAQLIASKPFPGSKKLRLFVEEAFTTRCKPLLGGCPIVPWLLATSLEAEGEILGKAQLGAWRGDRSEEGSQQVQLYLETMELTPGNKHSSCGCVLSPEQEPLTEQVPAALGKSTSITTTRY